MTIFFITIFLLYVIFVMVLVIGWNKSEASVVDSGDQYQTPMVSVIIAARNEADGIIKLLNDLSIQSHPHYEVIVVDDSSDDGTAGIVEEFAKLNNRFRLLKSSGQGKKQAISAAIDEAIGTIIVTTDADCQVGPSWVYNMCRHFHTDQTTMVFGAVTMTTNSLFDELQAQEFASLIGSGAAVAALGHPFLCNGANLAFRRSAFYEVDGYQGNFDIPSGDDEFLMRKIVARFPEGVRFAHDRDTVVTTAPNHSVRQLIHQRVRWAGKWNVHTGTVSKAVALFIFLFQLSSLIIIALTLCNWIDTTLALTLVFCKMAAEAIFLYRVDKFLQLRFSARVFLLLQLLYPMYVCYIGVRCNFASFEWKGRKSVRFSRSDFQQKPASDLESDKKSNGKVGYKPPEKQFILPDK